MSFNLVDAAKGLFTNELIGKSSAYLGENENSISKAISGIIPAILGGLADKATGSTDGANTVTSLATEADNAGFLSNLSSFADNDPSDVLGKGSGLLNRIFGDGRSNLLSNIISQFSGVKNSSASSLLSLAVPAILGMLGRHVKSNNLDAGGLSSLLGSQKANIMNAVPAGLNLGNEVGSSSTHASEVVKEVHTTSASHGHTTHHYDDNDDNGGGLKLIFPIIFLALLGAAVWYFTKDGCGGGSHKTETTTGSHGHTDTTSHDSTTMQMESMTAGRLDTATGDFIYNPGENEDLDLPNGGSKLTVGRNSTEYKLVEFLNNKNAMIDSVKGNWFEFTNVRFETGGSNIREESITQLRNLVMISKAYPTAQFKIGGYTDNTGNAASNKSLSQRRADAVAAKLKELGAAAAAITGAEGYGQEWPIASNDSPEGRAQNRRVAVNVKAK